MTESELGGDDRVPGLALDRYRRQIGLDEPCAIEYGGPLSEEEKDAIVDRLLDRLVRVERLTDIDRLPAGYEARRRLLRGLLNIRPPQPLEEAFVDDMDLLLQDEAGRGVVTDAGGLPVVSDALRPRGLMNAGRLDLWKGDITRLRADAIVNAANDRLLGCFQPLHNCIDNVIHSAAGPLLRRDCRTIMEIQGHPEYTGDAKVTRAYNLPSKFVLHTVGPIIGGEGVSDFQRNQLASCYRSCLDLAGALPGIRTIAFPCISTGVFNFPREEAAEIAVRTVAEWLGGRSHRLERVIFNVFLQEDLDVYARELQR